MTCFKNRQDSAPRVAIKTFGCKVNTCDSTSIARMLARQGVGSFDAGDSESCDADVWLVNTCAVTARAVSKYLKFVRSVARERPDAIIAVYGCGPTLERSVFDAPGVREFPRGKEIELVDFLVRATSAAGAGGCLEAATGEAAAPSLGRTRAFLKVADGCPGGCTYCVIPRLRGPLRSRPVADLTAEAAALQATGRREIVLAAIHLGLFGADLDGSGGLASLVRSVAAAAPQCRIRLSSIEVMEIDENLLSLRDLPMFAPHFHVPLQSGDDGVLSAMGRRYDRSAFLMKVRAVRAAFGQVGLTTDVIVGFPGETAEAFGNTMDACRLASFTRLHAFPFSPREGTPAADMPGRPDERETKGRMSMIIELGRELADSFRRSRIGDEDFVLVEREARGKPGFVEGLDGVYQRVVMRGGPDLRGSLVRARIVGVDGEACVANPI